MFTELFRVEGPWRGHLAISARPRGGDWLDEEMRAWRRAGIQFFSFPIVDRSIPTPSSDVHGFLTQIDAKLSQGNNAVIHCRQGVGRAGLMATALLIEQGFSPTEAIRRVSATRRV